MQRYNSVGTIVGNFNQNTVN